MSSPSAYAAIMLLVAPVLAADPATRPATTRPAPQVEVAFVLDTTGSMGGLIEGAKAKIWHIANQIVLGKPRPKVRMGLVAYRDKGDEYVTKVFDLTDNIDQVYADLSGFVASGGGDGPENVNQALFDAINKLSWSRNKSALRTIYLVGDYPPHNEYTDVPTYDKLAKAAITKGIYVNTVLCGVNADTAKVWQEIARLSDGHHMAISQDGGVQTVATPYDDELAALNETVGRTVLYFGDAVSRDSAKRLAEAAAPAAAGVAADRAYFYAASGKAARGDLLDALADGDADLGSIKQEELPDELKSLTPEQRTAHIEKLKAERAAAQKKIVELSAKRSEYIRTKLAESTASKPADAFDARVLETLKAQARDKGIKY